MKVLVTGSSGLIGSEAVEYYDRAPISSSGSTTTCAPTSSARTATRPGTAASSRAAAATSSTTRLDIRDRRRCRSCSSELKPDLIVHCAAQPSHDLAAQIPFDDFDVNAVGTLNLLEATRRHAPEAVFIFMSTNKVYGDAPERDPARGARRRAGTTHDPEYADGISESVPHRPLHAHAVRRAQGRGRRAWRRSTAATSA